MRCKSISSSSSSMGLLTAYSKRIFSVIETYEKDDARVIRCIKKVLREMKLNREQLESLYRYLYAKHLKKTVVYSPNSIIPRLNTAIMIIESRIRAKYPVDPSIVKVYIADAETINRHRTKTTRIRGLYVSKKGEHFIYLNKDMDTSYLLYSNLAHEMAHFVCRQIYGYNNVESHGPEWTAIAKELGAKISPIKKVSHLEDELYEYTLDGKVLYLTKKELLELKDKKYIIVHGKKITEDMTYNTIKPRLHSITSIKT